MADPQTIRQPSHADIAWTLPETPDVPVRLKGFAITRRDVVYEDGKRPRVSLLDPEDIAPDADEIKALFGTEIGLAKAAESAAIQRATDAEADATAKGQAIAGLNVQVGTLAQQLQAATDELARLKATPMATAADVAALNARLDALQQAAAPAPAQPDPPAPSPAADPTPAPQEG